MAYRWSEADVKWLENNGGSVELVETQSNWKFNIQNQIHFSLAGTTRAKNHVFDYQSAGNLQSFSQQSLRILRFNIAARKHVKRQ